jgi:hypothetical protein
LKARFKSSDKIAKRFVADMNGYGNFDIEVREGIPYVEIQQRSLVSDGVFGQHHHYQNLR